MAHVHGLCILYMSAWRTPDPSSCTRKGLNNIAQKCLAAMPGFLNSANFLFRYWTQLVKYYSKFQNFYVPPYSRFLSLVELERWLAEAFQHSRHVQARLFSRPFLEGQGGVTPIDSIVTAATAGQNFDRLLTIDLWPLGYCARKEVSIFELQPKSASLYVRK